MFGVQVGSEQSTGLGVSLPSVVSDIYAVIYLLTYLYCGSAKPFLQRDAKALKVSFFFAFIHISDLSFFKSIKTLV